MTTCYLDANVLISFSDPDHKDYSQTKDLMIALVKAEYELAVSSLSLDEFIHNSMRFATTPKAQTIGGVRKAMGNIFQLPRLKLVNAPLEAKKHLRVLALIQKHDLHARDAYHVFIMQEAKIKYLATFDQDFEAVFKTGKVKKFLPE